MIAQRYEFLEKLHTALQPRGYIEIGVQAGGSLALANCDSVGIDPVYQVQVPLEAHHRVCVNTSDDYFASIAAGAIDLPAHIDLAFIDGMHLVEYALRDFTYIERYANERTVVVFDDVLPYNAAIAKRVQPPGDWTGDVWKIINILRNYRPDLALTLVDTHPTGSLVVTGVNPQSTTLADYFNHYAENIMKDVNPPEWILTRRGAVSHEEAIEIIMRGRS